MRKNGVPGAFGRRSNAWEKGRRYFGAPPQKQERIGPPYGKKKPKAFTYCLGIEILALGGAPEPTLEFTNRFEIGHNLGLELEMWLLNYTRTTDWAELSAQFAKIPAFLALRESEEGEREPWLQGKPWNVMDNPLQNTVGGLYIVSWPSCWKDCRKEEVDSNVGFTAIFDGEKYSLGVFVAAFEYLAKKPKVVYEDGNRFIGLYWEFKDEEGRLITVTLRQDELSKKVPVPEIQEGSGADKTA